VVLTHIIFVSLWLRCISPCRAFCPPYDCPRKVHFPCCCGVICAVLGNCNTAFVAPSRPSILVVATSCCVCFVAVVCVWFPCRHLEKAAFFSRRSVCQGFVLQRDYRHFTVLNRGLLPSRGCRVWLLSLGLLSSFGFAFCCVIVGNRIFLLSPIWRKMAARPSPDIRSIDLEPSVAATSHINSGVHYEWSGLNHA